MEQRLKNRLVGASVIVALVVIFVPEYFDEETEVVAPATDRNAEAIDDFSSRIVPLAESDDTVSQPTSSSVEPEIEPDVDNQVDMRDVEGPIAQPFPVPLGKPSTDVDGNVERVGLTVWAVQLASFSQSSNALTLRDSLREQGYAAFVQTVVGEQGSVTRVYVGPELFREQAETIRKKLTSETSLEAMVVKYPGG